MSDNTVLHIGENSPEYVAYRLLKDICNAEGRGPNSNSNHPVTREYLLQTYAQCYAVVKHGWDGTAALKQIPTPG